MPECVLRKSCLHDRHLNLEARMVDFAGYHMPLQYGQGILAEHEWTRQCAGLFDVSHMGPAFLRGAGGGPGAAGLEELVCGNIAGLKPGRMRYTLLLNDAGGIEDDLMIVRPDTSDDFLIVANSARKADDFARITKTCGPLEIIGDTGGALLALQGPEARSVLSRLAPDSADMSFLSAKYLSVCGFECLVMCAGYTGEDGFELLVPADGAGLIFDTLLDDGAVWPIGLGARDTLRLEAGLCLYGQDMDAETNPVEAALEWTISPVRRLRQDFPGAKSILAQLENGPAKRRVGLIIDGKVPARTGAAVLDPKSGEKIGYVTSGAIGISVGVPIAMAYLTIPVPDDGTPVQLDIRGKRHDARLAPMPFLSPRQIREKR